MLDLDAPETALCLPRFAGVLIGNMVVRKRLDLAMQWASSQTSREEAWWQIVLERVAALDGLRDGTAAVVLALYRGRRDRAAERIFQAVEAERRSN